MKQWFTHSHSKKKLRGLKRKCRTFSNYITEKTEYFPLPKNNDPSYPGYSTLQICFDDFFPDSKKTPNSVRKFFVQTIINRIKLLIDMKTESQREYRVFCTFPLPNLIGAQITILFTKKGLESFYEGLFSQEADGHRLISLNPDLEIEWGLHLPNGVDVKGFRADGEDNDYPSDEIWLIGILS
ncbi:DUF3916 domain-containing protein [Neobacillus sp. C211]|uniref:DUF3916 domain-containing protein n=1 Tax=unclassified Neobacillus TaxID=2675272 RepID=UPI00397ADD3F